MQSQESSNDQEQMIVSSTGQPYKTDRAAAMAMVQRGCDPEVYEVREHPDGGFAICEKGIPMPAPVVAAPASIPVASHAEAEEKAEAEEEYNDGPQAADVPQEEEHWRVRFQQKQNETETDNVILSVNGDTLNIKRGEVVVIPNRFKECADHATRQQFRQLPNESRKVVAHIKTYPYDLLGSATKQEYLAMRRAGTNKARQKQMASENADSD